MKQAPTANVSQQQQQQLSGSASNNSPIMVAPEEFSMPRLGGDNNSINNNSSATGGGILHSPPPPLLSASGGVGGRTQVVSHSPGVFSVPATNHTTMTAPGAAASSTTMNHMDDYDNCLRRDTESLFGPIDDEGSSSSLLRGGGVASGGGGGGLLQHPKIRVPPLRFSGGGGGGGASAGATLGGVIKINHNVLGSGSGQQAPATTTTPVMGNAVAGGSFTFGSASVQRSGDVHNISAAGTGGGHGTGGGVGLHGSSRFLPLSTNVPSPHFGRNIQALHVGSSTNSGSNSAVGGSSGVLAPTHASTFQSGSVAAYHSATHHISSLTGVHSPSSLSAHPFSQPGTPGGGAVTSQQQQQQLQSQSNNNSKPNPHNFPAAGHQHHSNSGASPPLGMPPLPPPSPGAAAGAAHSNGFPFSMEEIADNDQVMTQMAHAVARHSGLREPSTVAECQELLETFMREMQRPPSGVPQTVSGGNPSPRALGGSTSAVDGRATIVAELQWADGRDAPVPHHIGQQQHSASAGGGDWGTNSWPHRSAQPIDLAIVNGALTPSSSGHLTRNSGPAPGSSNTTPRTSSTILRGSPATHALLAGVSPRGALPVNNSHNPYSYHRFQDPNGSASTRPEEDTNAYSQPKPRRSAPKIHPAAQRSPTVNLHSSSGSTTTTTTVAAPTDVIDPAAVAAVATSYATIASGAAAAQRNNNINGGGNNNNAAATSSQSVGNSQRTTSQYHHGHSSSSHPTSSSNHSHGHQHSHTGGGGGGGFALSLGHPATTSTTIVASALGGGGGAGNMSVGNITVSTSSNGSVGICPPQQHHHVSNRPGAVRPGGVPEAIPSRGKKVERSASSAFSECSTSSTTDLVAPHEQSSSHLAPPSTSSRHQAKRN